MADPQWTRRGFLRALTAAAPVVALAGCTPGFLTRNQSFTRDEIPYGTEPMQVGELVVPISSTPTTRPVVVLVHGGYWKVGFTRSVMDELADDLSRRGYATWNIDYRRMGEPGGGFPGTLSDVALAIDKLAELSIERRFDIERVAVIGHSAGAQLALWSTTRATIPTGEPGAAPKVRPVGVVSLAGVVDMVASAAPVPTGTSEADLHRAELPRSVVELLGGTPDRAPDRYAATSPQARLPLGVPQLLIHGNVDDRVPLEQSRAYVAAAASRGDQARLIELPNVDHFGVLRPNKAWWDEAAAWLATIIGEPPT